MVDKVVVPEYVTSDTPPPNWSAPAGPIEVIGEKSAVEAVVAEIENKISEMKNAGYDFADVSVGAFKAQIFTRNKAQLIHEVLQESGSTVIGPPKHIVPAAKVFIFGPSGNKRQAVVSVYEKADKFYVKAIDLCKPFRDAKIGAKAHARNVVLHVFRKPTIRAIEKECDVEIEWPANNLLDDLNAACYVSIIGKSEEAIRSATGRLVEFLQAYNPGRFEYIDVEPLHHKHIRGKDTKGTEKIGAAHSVELIFPKDTDEPQIVLVYEGDSKDEEEIRKALQDTRTQISDVVSKQAGIISKTISVSKEYVHPFTFICIF